MTQAPNFFSKTITATLVDSFTHAILLQKEKYAKRSFLPNKSSSMQNIHIGGLHFELSNAVCTNTEILPFISFIL